MPGDPTLGEIVHREEGGRGMVEDDRGTELVDEDDAYSIGTLVKKMTGDEADATVKTDWKGVGLPGRIVDGD